MTKPFVMYRNTKDRTEFEREAEVMEQMHEDSEECDFADFDANCEHAELDKELGYTGEDDDLTLEEDWSVSVSKSTYGGLPCFILSTAECDFIFLKPEDANMLHEAFAQDMSPLEWKRRTTYGNNALAPR